MKSHRVFCAAAGSFLVISLKASAALAADAGVSSTKSSDEPNDVAALLKKLDAETSTLSTSDCTAACRALASIRRAADKICALEPGPRCDAARDKANDATKRVRDACPDCSLAMGPTPNERAATTPKPDSVQAAPPTPEPGSANSPAKESERGGCKSCSSTAERRSTPDIGFIALAALGLARILGRRKKRE